MVRPTVFAIVVAAMLGAGTQVNGLSTRSYKLTSRLRGHRAGDRNKLRVYNYTKPRGPIAAQYEETSAAVDCVLYSVDEDPAPWSTCVQMSTVQSVWWQTKILSVHTPAANGGKECPRNVVAHRPCVQ